MLVAEGLLGVEEERVELRDRVVDPAASLLSQCKVSQADEGVRVLRADCCALDREDFPELLQGSSVCPASRRARARLCRLTRVIGFLSPKVELCCE